MGGSYRIRGCLGRGATHVLQQKFRNNRRSARLWDSDRQHVGSRQQRSRAGAMGCAASHEPPARVMPVAPATDPVRADRRRSVTNMAPARKKASKQWAKNEERSSPTPSPTKEVFAFCSQSESVQPAEVTPEMSTKPAKPPIPAEPSQPAPAAEPEVPAPQPEAPEPEALPDSAVPDAAPESQAPESQAPESQESEAHAEEAPALESQAPEPEPDAAGS